VEKLILVNVPVGTADNQWTQVEDFPQLGGDRLDWVVEIAGVRWRVQLLEQVPARKWRGRRPQGATNAGAVRFEDVGGGQASVQLVAPGVDHGLPGC